MATELFVILVLVLANGLFAGAEIAVLTVRASRVQQGVSRRHGGAIAVQSLRDQPERFLATVQIGITVISTAAAAFGGASFARSLTPVLEDLGFGRHAGEVAFGLVIALVSVMSLILGELVPKSLALRYSDGYSFLVSRPLLVLARIAAPLVWFLTFCSNLVLRLFGDRTSFIEARMSRDELQQLVTEAGKSGSVDAKASEIASRALELRGRVGGRGDGAPRADHRDLPARDARRGPADLARGRAQPDAGLRRRPRPHRRLRGRARRARDGVGGRADRARRHRAPGDQRAADLEGRAR